MVIQMSNFLHKWEDLTEAGGEIKGETYEQRYEEVDGALPEEQEASRYGGASVMVV